MSYPIPAPANIPRNDSRSDEEIQAHPRHSMPMPPLSFGLSIPELLEGYGLLQSDYDYPSKV